MDNPHNPLHTVASAKNLGPAFQGVDWAVFSVSTIIVLIRLFTRIWITHNIGWDDAMMALTQAITAVGKGFVVTEVSYGLGQHRSDLSIQNYRNFLKYYYLDTAQFFIALATCKISICLFLLRLSHFNKLKRGLWSLIVFLVITHLIFFLLVVLQCSPIHKVWDLGVPGKCFSLHMVMHITIAQGVISFLTDFLLAAFPIVLLRNLAIPRRSRIGLCVLMSLGVITGAVAIARTATAYEILAPDLSWVAIPTSFTRIFEVNIGNIAACVPVLKPFARWVHARHTGRDPHNILGRKTSDSETHARWYRRYWQSRREGKEYEGYGDGQVERALPPGVVKMKAMGAEHSESQSETQRSASIGLPMQGVRKGDEEEGDDDRPDVPNARDSQYYRSHSGALGEVRNVKDIV